MGIARDLAEPPIVMNYYAVPPRRAGSGPGWYMGPDFEHLTYLGYSSAAAEVRLIQMLNEEEGARA